MASSSFYEHVSASDESLQSDWHEESISSLSSHGWSAPVANTECTLHQLAPYIGKLKSCIAADLLRTFTTRGQLIADPFCGAGTIPLEAALAERRIFASDISPYAELLTKAKTDPPLSPKLALEQISNLLDECERIPVSDLRSVPAWVRSYFHPRTLKEVISFSTVCRAREHAFAFSCLLGILHHQRPGFLSYPSSHLVPYLRDKKFPCDQFAALYTYRPLKPRLLAKAERAYKRFEVFGRNAVHVVNASIDNLILPENIDAIITSPPYMNALDYGRDNRLRLWFVDPAAADYIDAHTPSTNSDFARVMTVLAAKANASLKPAGYCILIVGDVVTRGALGHPADAAVDIFRSCPHSFRLISTLSDSIPDVRRSRRDCRGVKSECVVVLQKGL